MRRYRFLMLLPACALFGCATPSATSKLDGAVAAKDELICFRETSGTRIPQVVCRTQEQLDSERRQAEDLVTRTWMKPRIRR